MAVQDAFHEIATYTHYRSNLKLVKAILEESASTIDWLAAHGLNTELVANTQEVHQRHPRVYHQYIDKFAAFDRMIANFKKQGGRLLLETAGIEILRKGDKIIGVKAKQREKSLTIRCQAVIVADGGYIGNPKLVNRYLAIDQENLYSMGERKATGDGIQMLTDLGADLRHMGVFENHAATVISPLDPKWHNNTIFTLTNIPLLWVDGAGQRFVDESVCYDFALWGNATYTAGGYYYVLLDQPLISLLEHQSLNWTDSFERTFASLHHQPVTHKIGPFTNIGADLAEAVEKKTAWKADSLENLAVQLKLPIAELQRTVARYNKMVLKKKDTDFYKPVDFMKFVVENGPFYALKARSTSLGTIGGIETNANLQALKRDKSAIPGAFVAGNDASGMYDTSYPTLEGISCAFAWNSGRLAGQSAVKFLNAVGSIGN